MTVVAISWKLEGEKYYSLCSVCRFRNVNDSRFFCSLIDGTDVKIVYRHYATLYFVFCVDSSESELGILDLIQV